MVVDILSCLLMTILVLLGSTFLKIVLPYIKYMLILQIWSKHNFLVQLKFFAPIMRWNIRTRFLSFLAQQGTLIQRSCPHTSQQNGRAERKHRHILDSVRAQLLSASCSEKFWGEAALTSVYVINRLPSQVIYNVSPFEQLYGTSPSYSNLKVFGCACFVLLHSHEHTKLEPRARLCCFLGYGTEHKGFLGSHLLTIAYFSPCHLLGTMYVF
ncbi:hypothetical protein IC582_029203 [Cucumis melo]